MQEWIIDLDNTLKFIKSSKEYQGLKLYLIGHSLGGYAALSILSLHKEIHAVVALAPVNDAFTLMVDVAKAKIGKIASITKPFFNLAQRICFGKYVKFNAIQGINSTVIPVLIVQGDNDKVISMEKISVYSNKEKITNPNVRLLQTKGLLGGHDTLWHSVRSVKYKQRVDDFYKKQLRGARYSKKVDYFKGINDNLYSEASGNLVKMIDAVFCLN
jgi:alpha-beta hydrolase superfamily lysophospholipase